MDLQKPEQYRLTGKNRDCSFFFKIIEGVKFATGYNIYNIDK